MKDVGPATHCAAVALAFLTMETNCLFTVEDGAKVWMGPL